MSALNCAACTTPYPPDLDACPHCGSVEYTQEGVVVARRLPAFVTLTCVCGRGPWQFRLPVVATGLVQLPALHCASCGSQVRIPWPPTEDAMPKITRHGGPTNARDAESSPDADASQLLLDGAEAVQEERPTAVEGELVGDGAGEALPDLPPDADGEDAALLEGGGPSGNGGGPGEAPDYDGMTLAELREEANSRDIPSYGTKAQITERLKAADAAV